MQSNITVQLIGKSDQEVQSITDISNWIDQERQNNLDVIQAEYESIMADILGNRLSSVDYLNVCAEDALGDAYMAMLDNPNKLFTKGNLPKYFKSTFFHLFSKAKWEAGGKGKVYTSATSYIDNRTGKVKQYTDIDYQTGTNRTGKLKKEASESIHCKVYKLISQNVKTAKVGQYCRIYIRSAIYGQENTTIAKSMGLNRRTIERNLNAIKDMVGVSRWANRLHDDYWEANREAHKKSGNAMSYPDSFKETDKIIGLYPNGNKKHLKVYMPRNKTDNHGTVKQIEHDSDMVPTWKIERQKWLPITAKISSQNNKAIKGQLSEVERMLIALKRNGLNTTEHVKMVLGIKPITIELKEVLEAINYLPISVHIESDNFYHFDKKHTTILQGETIADINEQKKTGKTVKPIDFKLSVFKTGNKTKQFMADNKRNNRINTELFWMLEHKFVFKAMRYDYRIMFE